MKKFFLIILSLYSVVAFAQQYNNEWIDYNKTYYKFRVGSNGVYRIPQSALAGIGLAATNVADFQLWRNGAEVPLFTSNQSGTLSSSGYIEFWGEANDGKPDNALYRNTNDQLNNTKSLFTDSVAYFLTVNPGVTNKRLTPTTNTIPTGATPEPYFIYTLSIPFNEAMHIGRPEGSGIGILYTSSYEQGKGWASNDIANGTTRTVQQNLYPYTGSGIPQMAVKMNVVGNYNVSRNVTMGINGNQIFNQTLSFYDYARLSSTTTQTVLNGAAENITVTNGATTTDRIRVALIELTYARSFNFGGASNFRFQIPQSATGKYLEISGFNFSGIPVLYDLSNGRRYEVDASNPSLLKVYLQPSSSPQDLVLVSQAASNIKNATAFETRNFVNYLSPANQGDYLMITHKNITTATDGSNPAEDYRAYRSTAAGGGYNAKLYMIDQLLDQFAYGIKFDPLSVRNFARWARNNFSVAPKMIFIAGKGVTYNICRTYESTYADLIAGLNLIPTIGVPGSDMLLTSEGASSAPLTPVGRVSIINGNELKIYLEKIKQYESAFTNRSPLVEESAWKKNVIHMVGANDQPTIDLLYSLLNMHKSIIMDSSYGAKVSDFVKNSSNSVQQTITDRLTELINSGVGMLTFFGHSSSTTLGFNLDDPMNYTNQGKYPLFNMMGCSVGDIFGFNGARLSGPDVLSEKYVLANNRGCIGMLAGTSIGYVNTLNRYNIQFYQYLSKDYYGKTVGEQLQNTVINVLNTGGETYQLQRSQCEQYTMNGDPAVRLYQFEKPDYAIEDQMVTVSPNFISIAETEFTIAAKIQNLGKATNRDLVVEVKRTFPDLSTLVIKTDTIRGGIDYMDSLTYHIPIDPVNDKGLNKITITIDPLNTIDELFETNNSITKEVYIFEDELRPVYPYHYAIINAQGIKFAASTANPLAETRNYLFEIDTTELFNSSVKISQQKTSTGGLIEFNPTITFKDSTVYYWRVASAPLPNEQPKWNSSSFVYINGSEVGFNQSHYYQFKENSYSQITLDSTSRQLSFGKRDNILVVKNGIWPTAVNTASALTVEVNDIVTTANTCNWGLIFNVFEKNSLKSWVNQQLPSGTGLYNSIYPCGDIGRRNNFEFPNTLAGRNNAYNFLRQIPEGCFVVLRTQLNAGAYNELAPQWKLDANTYGANTLYEELKRNGFVDIDSFNRVRALNFIYKQNGADFTSVSMFSNGLYDPIILTTRASTTIGWGEITSRVFGPAKAWDKFIWDGFSNETNSKDSVNYSIIGINSAGNETLLIPNITTKTYDISSISAQQYPSLKVKMYNSDNTNFTPYQLKYWRLYYTPIPEGVIAPNLFFNFKDSLEAGQPLDFGVGFKNVSGYNFDSLKVKLTIRDRNNNENIITVPKQKALIAGDTLRLQVPVPTGQFIGANSLYVDFNPDNDQPEQYHFNNFLYKDFYVGTDSVSPYLDVTFDGVHIINKDIVSSKPDILIKLTDDAKWLLLNSSDLIKVQLKFPSGVIRVFNFNNDTLMFNPATNTGGNSATVNFRPYLPEDGNYELIITAKDQSGNSAGDMQYRVAFQVINKPMISNMLNYPNPFTTSTAFVFTLTGSEIPQNIRIQILTITGKIVKEITKNELGPLRIGRNITEYKWDGTDQYGQKLANGVYLYRVIT
ncbi:MAG: C25 family cysteine peptidase, partial [Niabella sp.]